MEKKIAVIRGDGIGPEIVGEAIAVLDAVAEKFGHTFTYEEELLKKMYKGQSSVFISMVVLFLK